MNHFKSLTLSGCWPFKDAVLPIEPGITTIYGINRTKPNSRNSNGAGKSFLASQFQEIISDIPAVGVRKDRLASGTRTLEITTHEGRDIKVVRKNRKVEIHENGEIIERSLSRARKKLLDLIPIQDVEFSTYGMLDARVPHPFVMGDDAQRRKFFTDFFGLDRIDAQRKIYAAQLRDLKTVRAARDAVQATYKEVLASLKKLKAKLPEDVDAELADIQTQLDKAASLQEELGAYRRYKAFTSDAEDAIKTVGWLLKTGVVQNIDEDGLRAAIKTLRKTVAGIDKDIDAAADARSDLKAAKAYNDAVADMPERTQATYKKLLAKHGEDLLGFLRKRAALVPKYEREYDDLKVDNPEKPDVVKDPGYELGALESKLRALRHQANHAAKFKKGVCGECGQAVEVKNPETLKKLIKKVESHIRQVTEYADYLGELGDYKKELKAYKAFQADAPELEKKIKAAKAAERLYDRISRLPPVPETEVDKRLAAIDVKSLRKERDVLNKQVADLRAVLPHVDLLIKPPKKPKGSDIDVTAARDRQQNLLEVRAQTRMLRKQAKELKANLADYAQQLEHEEALQVLAEAYGPKAGKKMIVENISTLLVTEINKYARMVFPEHFQFSLEWSDAQCLMNCTRIEEDIAVTTDVRKLSGAQHILFVLVCVMATLTFVPPRKRINLLVFDEPSSNMHEETREAFYQFLQSMLTVIPSIIVVTPHSQEIYPDARAYTVVKEKGWSRLERGHPHSLELKNEHTKGVGGTKQHSKGRVKGSRRPSS